MRWLPVVVLVACGGPVASQPPRGTATVRPPWMLAVADGAAGLVDDRVFAWDRTWADGAGGIAEYDAADGHLIRTRVVAQAGINSAPGFWEKVPGGYLTAWDAPAFVREVDDRLEVAWRGHGDDWFDSHAIADGSLVIGLSRDSAAIERLDLATGRVQWRAPLVPWSQDVTVAVERGVVYATWQEYDPKAPTPTMTVPRRLRAYELATGRALWTVDFDDEPDGLVASAGVVVAGGGERLRVIDGASGKVRARPAVAPLNGRLLVDDDQVIAIDDHDVVALALTTGAERWRSPARFDGRPVLARWSDAILVSTNAGKLAALDRRTGAARWSIGLGLDPYRIWTSATAVVVDNGAAAGTVLPPTAATETAHLHGRIVAAGCGAVAGAQVTVDGERVVVDAGGAYSATVVARGKVIVSARPDPDDLRWEVRLPEVQAIVALDGRGDYTVVDLPIGRCP
jgi:outer membrane protein assembly factor BamB